MSRALPSLFDRFPEARERIPWIPLGDFPTPVADLGDLRGRVAPASVWVKRDDLSSHLYGGNKVRALEFLLADALARRADVVVAAGALGSHFVSATALFGREVGLRVEVVLWSQPCRRGEPRVRPAGEHKVRPYDRHAEALRLLAHLGVPVRHHPRPAAALAALFLAALRHRVSGRRVALLMPGGACPRGVLGFVDGTLELAEQMAAGEMPPPAALWVACGSGGSAAGLALGLSLAGLATQVRAVRVTPRIACSRRRLSGLARGARRLIEEGNGGNGGMEGIGDEAPPHPPNVGGAWGGHAGHLEIVEGFYAPGYGCPTPAAQDAAVILGELGLPGDITYTGRAMAALLEQARREGGCHLFWHTLSAVRAPVPDEVDLGRLPRALRRLLELH